MLSRNHSDLKQAITGKHPVKGRVILLVVRGFWMFTSAFSLYFYFNTFSKKSFIRPLRIMKIAKSVID